MIEFVIPGIPLPQERSRHRIMRMRDGRQFVGQYDPARSRNWKATVAWFASEAMRGERPVEGPLILDLVFCFLPPASTPKKRLAVIALGEEIPKQTRPDLDNLVKGVVDGCSGIVWRDDAQIYLLHARKNFSTHAEVRVSVKGE